MKTIFGFSGVPQIPNYGCINSITVSQVMNFGWFEMDLPAVFISASCVPCMPFLPLRPSGGTGRVWFGPDGAGLVGLQLITWNHKKISKNDFGHVWKSIFGKKKMSSKNRFAGGKLSTKNNEQTRWFPVQTVALHNFISPSVFFFRGVEGIRLNGRIPGATCIFRCRRIGSYGTRWWDILI